MWFSFAKNFLTTLTIKKTFDKMIWNLADVAKLADASDLGSGDFDRKGSSPFVRTNFFKKIILQNKKTPEENFFKRKVFNGNFF